MAGTTYSLQLCPYLAHKHDYVGKLDENWEKLQEEARRLDARKADVEEEIEKNKMTKKMTNECQVWIEDVDKTREKVGDLGTKYQKSRRSLYRTRAFFSRAKLSRDMEKKAGEIASLKDQMNPDRALTNGEPKEEENVSIADKIQEKERIREEFGGRLDVVKLSTDMGKKAGEIASLKDQMNPDKALTNGEPKREENVRIADKVQEEERIREEFGERLDVVKLSRNMEKKAGEIASLKDQMNPDKALTNGELKVEENVSIADKIQEEESIREEFGERLDVVKLSRNMAKKAGEIASLKDQMNLDRALTNGEPKEKENVRITDKIQEEESIREEFGVRVDVV